MTHESLGKSGKDMEQLLYIDPGTGSMLISILFGIMTTVFFIGKAALIKLKFIISGGKKAEADRNRQPFVIFTDSKRYWNVFEPICDEFERRKMPLAYYTQSEDDPALSKKYEFVRCEFIGRGNKGIARMNFLNADICLATTPGLDVLQWKRSKLCKCYVFTHHGIDDIAGPYKMFGIDYFDTILLTGDFQRQGIRELEELWQDKQKELVTVGYPPMDVLKAKLDSLPKRGKSENPTILVAPSWGKSAILSKFGAEFLEALVKTGFNVVVRPHPQSLTSEKTMLDEIMAQFPENDKFHWNFDNNNFDCMNDADILITDFSGIIFEFAFLFDKPLIYTDTQFDKSTYDAWWLKEAMWKFQVLPSIGIKLDKSQFENMKSVIEKAISSESLASGRDKAKDEAWMHRGEAAARVVDYLSEKFSEIEAERRQNGKQGGNP